MKLKIKLRDWIKRNRTAVKVSIFNAAAVFLMCYFIDNSAYSFTGGATLGQRFEQIKQLINPSEDKLPSDLLLVNVAYDRELADVCDEFGMPKGNIDITDRSKLLRLLRELDKSDYRYIILDLSFAKDYRTEDDEELFQLISGMDRIVVAKSANFEMADPALAAKARYSDYSTHIAESNFVKYEFVRNGEPTMPYQVYRDLYGKRLSSFAGFYFFKGKLANKSAVLRLPIKSWNRVLSEQGSGDIGQLQYYNLGSDILDIGLDIPAMAKDKIVVVGDFCENDMHDTYLGKISGPIININAFYALVNDNLSIPYFEIIFLLLLYFAISMLILKNLSLSKAIPFTKRIKSRALSFMFSFVGISFALTIIALLWYIIFGLDINILIPSLYFSIFGIIVKYKKTVRKS